MDTENITLREIFPDDLEIFFEHQKDPDAALMAAFTADDPDDRTAFYSRWRRILSNDTIIKRTILCGDTIAGHVIKFEQFGNMEITYWIGREYWGKGIASMALKEFLANVDERPLYARAAKDNLASRRVLEKCGFVLIGVEKGFANARGEEIEEVLMKLG
jgi:RimJ/RimL family protein N-acetyltransferase